MSNEIQRFSRARRLMQKHRNVKRQQRIARSKGMQVKEPHRYAKRNAMDCGNPKCWMCADGGRRERTVQELRSLDEMGIDYE